MNQKREESPFADHADPPAREKRPSSAQFSLAKMMLVFTVVAAAAAPLAYLTRALRGDRQSHFVFIIFCLAGPPLALIVVSLTYHLLHWLDRIRKR